MNQIIMDPSLDTARTLQRVTFRPSDWIADQADRWSTQENSARVRRGSAEWTELCGTLSLLGDVDPGADVLLEAVVSGRGDAAGMSFGAYKDFLVPLAAADQRYLLQLDLGRSAPWRFCINGRLQEAAWWNSEARKPDDLWLHPLRLKARHPDDVWFEEVALLPFAAPPMISVVMTSNRFAQRLRMALACWARQEVDRGSFEVIVVNPASPDATAAVVAAAAWSFPHLRLTELAVEADIGRNKGAQINRAARLARGRWVLLTDADCLFPPTTMARIMREISSGQPRLLFGERRHLSMRHAHAILAGALQPFENGLMEAPTHSDRSPFGYTQIVPRSVLHSVRYRETINHFAHTDEIFVGDCARRGIRATLLDGLACLHLTHPFSWYGTNEFL